MKRSARFTNKSAVSLIKISRGTIIATCTVSLIEERTRFVVYVKSKRNRNFALIFLIFRSELRRCSSKKSQKTSPGGVLIKVSPFKVKIQVSLFYFRFTILLPFPLLRGALPFRYAPTMRYSSLCGNVDSARNSRASVFVLREAQKTKENTVMATRYTITIRDANGNETDQLKISTFNADFAARVIWDQFDIAGDGELCVQRSDENSDVEFYELNYFTLKSDEETFEIRWDGGRDTDQYEFVHRDALAKFLADGSYEV